MMVSFDFGTRGALLAMKRYRSRCNRMTIILIGSRICYGVRTLMHHDLARKNNFLSASVNNIILSRIAVTALSVLVVMAR